MACGAAQAELTVRMSQVCEPAQIHHPTSAHQPIIAHHPMSRVARHPTAATQKHIPLLTSATGLSHQGGWGMLRGAEDGRPHQRVGGALTLSGRAEGEQWIVGNEGLLYCLASWKMGGGMLGCGECLGCLTRIRRMGDGGRLDCAGSGL